MDANNQRLTHSTAPLHSLIVFFQQSGMVAMVWLATNSVSFSADLASQQQPKTFYVTVEKASLYSGPSTDYYPTSHLRRGTALEVYQFTKTGWMAVRPPEGSFSWVPASQAYLLPGGRIIEITDPKAVSWIGTTLGSAKQYRWQVQLKVGEQLTVLGEASLKSGSDSEQETLWYRVAPPAGEFRWIEQSAVSETAPVPSSIEEASATTTGAREVEPDAVQQASYTQPQSKVAAENQLPEQAEAPGKASGRNAKVVTASSSGPTKRTSAGAATRPATSQPPNLPPLSSQWDDWHAFEPGMQGKRATQGKSPARHSSSSSQLAKAKPRQHDPLLDDPFSLNMVGHTSIPTSTAAGAQSMPANSTNTTAIIAAKRGWRDPRSLRESRLVDRYEDDETDALGDPESRVSLASGSTENVTTSEANVRSTGYETELATSPTPAVNWYGVSNASKPGNSVTTAQASRSVSNASRESGTFANANLADLQVALNEMVAGPMVSWNLPPLLERTRYLTEHGPDSIERGHARLLLERIEAFQSLAVRSGITPPASPVQLAGFTAPASSATAESLRSQAANFDATGWLVPVHAAAPDQPSHALTTDTGDVIAYVSGIPGLNVDRYKNQAVGISGLRGYLPQLRAPHIQAQRISQLK